MIRRLRSIRVAAALFVALVPAPLLAAPLVAAPDSPPPATPPAAVDGGVRALIEARQHAVLSSEIAGRIARLSVEPGQAFKAGQTLVAFDCSHYQATLDAARANARAADVTVRQSRRLEQLKSIGGAEVEMAEVKAEAARAEQRRAEIEVRRCEIKAPYDGRAVEQRIREQESVPAGTPLLEIVSDQDLRVELIVPSSWLVWLKPGQRFELRIDETGEQLGGEVALIGARVDPVSQSLKVMGKLLPQKGAPPNLVAGMSGTARFTPPGEVTVAR
ncbi:efflux RND transporter periplasmic adaptor subunit [Azospirillum canadense]|uniref:efflux RND transporter periplasmic adaptor subunit n=1 Tax=Azospirillum canadense TaxID=403962 RepID=UPI00222632A5|nr:efflux RND transporter periplasmic adaptor subunit [Azospirillum canadense]MCW2238367.1 RND family efflux transporter MFP subunit [Azospirillum canadense]